MRVESSRAPARWCWASWDWRRDEINRSKPSGPDFVESNARKESALVGGCQSSADSGNTFSPGFCPNCGSRIFLEDVRISAVCFGHRGKPRRSKPLQTGLRFFYVQRATLGSHGSQLAEVREQPKV